MIDENAIIHVKVFVRKFFLADIDPGAISRDELLFLSSNLVQLGWWSDLINLAEMVSARRDYGDADFYIYNITWLLPDEQTMLFQLKYQEKMPFIATIEDV